MKYLELTCKLSGLTFIADGVPHSQEIGFIPTSIHPILSLQEPEVRKIYNAMQLDTQTTPAQRHLVGTYYLSKLPLESWDVPLLSLADLETFDTFWARNLEKLVTLVAKTHCFSRDSLPIRRLPKFHITKTRKGEERSSVFNLGEWIKAAELALTELSGGTSEEARKRNREFNAKINENVYLSDAHKSEIISRGLRGSLLTKKESSVFSELIASWAARAGEFPSDNIKLPSGKRTTIRQHWINILQLAFQPNGTGMLDLLTDDVTMGDIDELLEHCTCNIPNDTTHAILFFKELGQLASALEEYKMPAKKTTAQMLELLNDEVSSIPQTPKKLDNIDPAAPKREDYATLSEFLRAKVAYSAGKETPNVGTITTDIYVEI